MKLIAAIDVLDGKVIRLTKGQLASRVVYGEDPVQTALRWEKEGADAVHVVDLSAALTRGCNTGLVKKITERVKIPIQAAGGIRTLDFARKTLQSADRIVLGTLAFEHPEQVDVLLKEFGAEKIVVAVDERRGKVMIDGWRKSSGTAVHDAVEKFLGMGVRYFLVTNVERDGTLLGPDVDALKGVCSISGANIIASGGIAATEDVVKVAQTGAHAVVLGKALYEEKVKIADLRAALGANPVS
ncbi:MAG: 1-(5-phosphoribosyl)-5-[(5-phosphoribosylamino)methylideneamino] imidazole-4-carboxamide isomerase [Planctomycetota bacterium]|nr:1-(5-phosphoribosyl)-5-[(5-phosphoribosylamino)methylideneamino] imidazole-4-carboxamide isomerase [Planctomycetota bacterium]